MIVRAHHAQITIPPGAEAAARDFYVSFLGLAEIPKPAALLGRGGFWLGLGDFQIHVGTEDGFDRSLTKAHLAYEVEDLDRWREKLGGRGVEIVEGLEIPGFRRFEFRDPFGNRVEFLERTGKI
jgi:catechol 2,3-dioxygenase-like lactoylglutathione lyase family enzyme